MNTKEYKVIPIEDFGVVVDDKVTATSLVLLPDGTIKEMDYISLLDYLESESDATKNIMATIGKRLGAIPLIELPNKESSGGFPEDLWEQYRKPLNKSMSHFERNAFIGGYTANTSKYSEEDMNQALFIGAANPRNPLTAAKKLHAYKQSLQKQPIPTKVELEMEKQCSNFEYNHCADFHSNNGDSYAKCNYCIENIKITNKETNTITAVNYK